MEEVDCCALRPPTKGGPDLDCGARGVVVRTASSTLTLPRRGLAARPWMACCLADECRQIPSRCSLFGKIFGVLLNIAGQSEVLTVCNLQKRMAPQVGLEPTTLRLTAGCSAI